MNNEFASPLRRHVYSQLRNLIIVPGHAIYVGHKALHATRIAYWKGTFQAGYKGDDEARFYNEHVCAGVKALVEDLEALLVFSGGQTREEVGPFSEAQSYWSLAEQADWFGHVQVRERATTEDFARDSFENLRFSLFRFHQCTETYPVRIRVCGFAFKEDRYKAHFQAILTSGMLGSSRPIFEYERVNDPPYYRLHGLHGGQGSIAGEAETLKAFHDCPLGDRGKLLQKRFQRDPFCRGNPYESSSAV